MAESAPKPITELFVRFSEVFESELFFLADKRLLPELKAQAEPVLESVAEGLAGEGDSLDGHESLALLALLGRRAAMLGVSPSGLVAMASAIAATFGAENSAVSRAIAFAVVEGFGRGIEEKTREDLEDVLCSRIPIVNLTEDILALRLIGPIPAGKLERRATEFARRLHRGDAKAAFLDLQGIAPERSMLRVLTTVLDGTILLGIPCVCVGEDAWWDEFSSLPSPYVVCDQRNSPGVSKDAIIEDEKEQASVGVFFSEHAAALQHVLALSGLHLESEPSGPISRLLRRFSR